MESDIERLGVNFCITGQPQHDAYSKAVTDRSEQAQKRDHAHRICG